MYGEDRAREYASMHGQDVETEDPEDYTPITCPRCRRQTPRDKDVCMWCNQALDHDTFEDLEETKTTVRDMALQLFQEDGEFVEDVVTRKAVTQMMLNDDDFFEEALDVAENLDIDLPTAVE